MALPIMKPDGPLLLKPEPLTPNAFAPFGTVISMPLAKQVTEYPSSIPKPLHADHQPNPVAANQRTALKTSPISPLTNNYADLAKSPSKGLMSIFSSFPRQNTYLTSDHTLRLKLGILERHPYTTQTFCPFNYSSPSPSTPVDKAYMLVIVGPTHHSLSSIPPNPPDVSGLRAFLAPLNTDDGRQSNMAVTYAPGTWHAPMVVLGSRRVDFLVTQFVNGVADDDCQEVLVGSGPDENELSEEVRRTRKGGEGEGVVEVEVDVSFLLEGGGERMVQRGREKAKL